MIVFSFLASALVIIAIVLLLDLTPERVTDDILKIIAPKDNLKTKIRIAQGKKKSRQISKELNRIHEALNATGKGNKFTLLCALSLFLCVGGAFLSVIIGNVFLMPVFMVSFAVIPFLYAKNSISYYEKHIRDEMETALSIITTSYIRSDDIVESVRENINYIKPPIKEIFKAFLGDAIAVSADIPKSLAKMKDKIDNDIFSEWCDTLISCQDDRTLKDSLLSVVTKLTDVRIVNNELKTMIAEPKKEYFMMVALVVGNIPLLYLLNKDWFSALMFTTAGKITLGICGIVIMITTVFMKKYTRPIEYKR